MKKFMKRSGAALKKTKFEARREERGSWRFCSLIVAGAERFQSQDPRDVVCFTSW
jgi:hypothetical protein